MGQGRAMTSAVRVSYPYVYSIPDRHGNPRLYFWRGRGHPRIRIREAPGTAEFQARYDELLKPVPATGGKLRATPRTWRWLLTLYFDSPQFRRLAENTRSNRRLMLEATCREPIAPGVSETFADFPLDRLTSKAIRVLRDRKATETPHAANARLKNIRVVFAWAMEAEHVRANPARDVAMVRAPTEGFHAWTLAEVEQFEARHAVGTQARLALDLMLYTGARRSDAIRLGRQHVRDNWIRFKQVKTGTAVEIPVLPSLQATIDASPTGDLTFLVNKHGRSFRPQGFSAALRRWCKEAGLSECSSHGLRKASAVRAAEAGATVHQLMAIYGWLTLGEAERYTRTAQRRKLSSAAITLLSRPSS
jgi:integrase